MIREVISQFLVNELGLDEKDFNDSTTIKGNLGLDSTETVMLALELKKKFKIDYEFQKDDITISELCEQISNQIESVNA